MLSDDLTRTQAELHAAIRAESFISPLTRLWARVVHRGGDSGERVERNRADGVAGLEPLPEPAQRRVVA